MWRQQRTPVSWIRPLLRLGKKWKGTGTATGTGTGTGTGSGTARSGLLLLVVLSIYTTLWCITSPHSSEGPAPGSDMVNMQMCTGPDAAVHLDRVKVGQCPYNLTHPHPIPRVGTRTGTGTGTAAGNNILFVYDTTLEFEQGGSGQGMAYFVAFLEAETPKYMDGGNHGSGAGLSAASSLFTSSFQCHWSIPRDDGASHSMAGEVGKVGKVGEPDPFLRVHTPVAWYLNGDTSTFSFYCRIPASVGAHVGRVASGSGSGSGAGVHSVGLRLSNSAFTSPDHSVDIPMCERDSRFHRISVCTQPLHAPLTPHQLKQWMEYHYLVGVDHFYIYDRDESFASMLAPYEQAGLATRYSFPLLTKGMEARWYDQPQAMHVCLHRHRRASRWIFFLDVDEYLHSDQWTHKGPHVAKLMDRYEEAPLYPYTHLIVWKRTAVPQQRDAPWDQNNTLELEHLTKYGQPERVAVKFALRPWDGRTLSIHHPNSFVQFNSKEMDLPIHDLVISHLKLHNTLTSQQIDTAAKPPHPWIITELRHRVWNPEYQVTSASVTVTDTDIATD